jgi:hypothetical protein
MKTEIQGDFLGYLTRFKMPSAQCFKFPLKSAASVFLVQLISAALFGLIGFSAATAIIMLLECLFVIGFYVKVLYKDFWNVVLEESKGFFADLIMWVYYFLICALTLTPAAVFFIYLEKLM